MHQRDDISASVVTVRQFRAVAGASAFFITCGSFARPMPLGSDRYSSASGESEGLGSAARDVDRLDGLPSRCLCVEGDVQQLVVASRVGVEGHHRSHLGRGADDHGNTEAGRALDKRFEPGGERRLRNPSGWPNTTLPLWM